MRGKVKAGGSTYWIDRISVVAPAGGDSRAICLRASVFFASSVAVTVKRVRGAKSPALSPSHAPSRKPSPAEHISHCGNPPPHAHPSRQTRPQC